MTVMKSNKTIGAIEIEDLIILSKLMMLKKGDLNQDSNHKTIFSYSKILIYQVCLKHKKLED
jgi:hypothetical protein